MNDSLWHETLGSFQESVGAPQPMPAGVATAAVSAALGLSLLVKVLRIRGIRPDLLRSSQELIEELRDVADADIAAIRTYLQHRDTRGLNEVPARAQHAVAQALALCVEAEPEVTGLIAADVRAAAALLDGAANAIAACIAANKTA
ncbi:MAG: Formiminotransferase-cyclodeaminase [Acidobacteriota bacterium]|jgi:formiminotetrahydrofolate cyclodeaminase